MFSKMTIKLEFNKRALVIGAVFDNLKEKYNHLFICFIPCVVLHITWRRYEKDEARKWNCCDKLVKPSELAEHYKREHLNK